MTKEYNLVDSTYNYNDFLVLFTMLRIYFVICSLIVNTRFYSGRIDRIRYNNIIFLYI